MQTRACTSCGARIGFIQTPADKWLPVDPEPVRTFGVLISSRSPIARTAKALVNEYGGIVRYLESSLTNKDADALEGYVPHWSTCTDPKAHRR